MSFDYGKFEKGPYPLQNSHKGKGKTKLIKDETIKKPQGEQ